MVSKKNLQHYEKLSAKAVQHYGLRKLSVGVASVLLGTSFLFSTVDIAQAATISSDNKNADSQIGNSSTDLTTKTVALKSVAENNIPNSEQGTNSLITVADSSNESVQRQGNTNDILHKQLTAQAAVQTDPIRTNVTISLNKTERDTATQEDITGTLQFSNTKAGDVYHVTVEQSQLVRILKVPTISGTVGSITMGNMNLRTGQGWFDIKITNDMGAITVPFTLESSNNFDSFGDFIRHIKVLKDNQVVAQTEYAEHCSPKLNVSWYNFENYTTNLDVYAINPDGSNKLDYPYYLQLYLDGPYSYMFSGTYDAIINVPEHFKLNVEKSGSNFTQEKAGAPIYYHGTSNDARFYGGYQMDNPVEPVTLNAMAGTVTLTDKNGKKITGSIPAWNNRILHLDKSKILAGALAISSTNNYQSAYLHPHNEKQLQQFFDFQLKLVDPFIVNSYPNDVNNMSAQVTFEDGLNVSQLKITNPDLDGKVITVTYVDGSTQQYVVKHGVTFDLHNDGKSIKNLSFNKFSITTNFGTADITGFGQVANKTNDGHQLVAGNILTTTFSVKANDVELGSVNCPIYLYDYLSTKFNWDYLSVRSTDMNDPAAITFQIDGNSGYISRDSGPYWNQPIADHRDWANILKTNIVKNGGL